MWPERKGGLEAQVTSYYADCWEHFGLTPLTVWDVSLEDFIGMTFYADRARAEKAKLGNGN